MPSSVPSYPPSQRPRVVPFRPGQSPATPPPPLPTVVRPADGDKSQPNPKTANK
jgi:hypothetical protein